MRGVSWQAALRFCAGTLSCAVLGLLAGSDQASASAGLISANPEPGTVVDTIPVVVLLTFDEPVLVTADGVRVFGPDGAEVDNGHTGHFGGSATVGVDLPSINRPSTNRPSVDLPRLDLPRIDLPSVDLPSVDLPGISQPSSTEQGTYTVVWRVISANSNQMAGTFTFSVGHPSAGWAPQRRHSPQSTG